MIQLSFKNRIALSYIIGTGLLILLVFLTIFHIVKFTVYKHVEDSLTLEIENHLDEIKLQNGTIFLIDLEEWKEREHNRIDVNPVFIQFLDTNKVIIEKSPNLKLQVLKFNPKAAPYEFYNTKIFGYTIRQVQLPFYLENEKKGYLMIAMSLSDSQKVLDNLFDVMSIAFPLIMVLLFFLARFFAGRSIQPINAIIGTANSITTDHLKARIPLPQNKDELYVLSATINNLLERIEAAIEREKQFTSDASHELRTPLTVIKGTLEVLIRKPRNTEEYESKIKYCIAEVNRLNRLVDELLLLARFEDQNQSLKIEELSLNSIILEVLSRFSEKIDSKKCTVICDFSEDFKVITDHYLLAIVLNNLISNALKYSKENGTLEIQLAKTADQVTCTIKDNGIGIAESDLENIFHQFYRSNAGEHPEIKGTGLGLSIVRKLCYLLEINISISSKENEGTQVQLLFSKNSFTS